MKWRELPFWLKEGSIIEILLYFLGYVNVGESKSCEVEGDSPMLLIPMGHEIRGFSDNKYEELVLAQRRITSLDVDITSEVVYWLDTSLMAIKRAKIPNMAGQLGVPQTLLSIEAGEAEGIAYDWLGK